MVNIDLQKKVMYNVFMEQRNYPVYTFELIKNFPYSILLDVAYTEVHSHIFWELVYCLKGESLNTINGTAHKITRGKALIIRPQDVPRQSFEARSVYPPRHIRFGRTYEKGVRHDRGRSLRTSADSGGNADVRAFRDTHRIDREFVPRYSTTCARPTIPTI